jgi:hypothetical protein
MGQIAFNSGIAKRLFDSAYKFIGHVPGGLAMATVEVPLHSRPYAVHPLLQQLHLRVLQSLRWIDMAMIKVSPQEL